VPLIAIGLNVIAVWVAVALPRPSGVIGYPMNMNISIALILWSAVAGYEILKSRNEMSRLWLAAAALGGALGGYILVAAFSLLFCAWGRDCL